MFGPRRRPNLLRAKRLPMFEVVEIEVEKIEIHSGDRDGRRERVDSAAQEAPKRDAESARPPLVDTERLVQADRAAGGVDTTRGRRLLPRMWRPREEQRPEQPPQTQAAERHSGEDEPEERAMRGRRHVPRPHGGLRKGETMRGVANLMRAAVLHQDMEAVAAMLDAVRSDAVEVGEEVDEAALVRALLAASSHDSVPALKRAFATLARYGIEVDEEGLRLCAAARLMHNDWEGFHSILASMREKGYAPDAYLYAAWARRLILGGKIEQVPRVLDAMRTVDRQRPPAFVYSSVIDAIHSVYGHKMAIDAVELAFARNDFEGEATPLYNSAIRLCLRDKRYRQAEGYWERMRARGVPLDGYTFSMVLNMLAKQARHHEMVRLFRETLARGEVPMSGVHLTTYVEGLLMSHRFERAWALLAEMERVGSLHPPSAHTYSLFIKSLCDPPRSADGAGEGEWGYPAPAGLRLDTALSTMQRAESRGVQLLPTTLRTLYLALKRDKRDGDAAKVQAKLRAAESLRWGRRDRERAGPAERRPPSQSREAGQDDQ